MSSDDIRQQPTFATIQVTRDFDCPVETLFAHWTSPETTLCPLTSGRDLARATGWLRAAIQAGHYRFVESDQDFPKHVWHQDESGQIWFEYKGWPINEDDRRAVLD